MRLILIRHGETPSNVKRLLDTGDPGPGLTDRGHQQAAGLVPTLASEQIDAIYVSNLVRIHHTAVPLAAARGLTPIERAGLREIRAGDLEMAGDEPSAIFYRDVVTAWSERDLAPIIPGGERGDDVLARFDEVVREIRAGGHASVAVVSHGAVIRCWATNRAVNLPAEFSSRHLLHNTDRVVCDLVDGDWFVRSWSHLENLDERRLV